MDVNELKLKLDRVFSKRIRLVGENSRGQFSASWILWGNKSDFYFGVKGVSSSLKVSFHPNGVGYFAYDRTFFERKNAEGFELPSKSLFEWKLPVPESLGAVHAASIFLPSDYYRSDPLTVRERRNTMILGVEDRCAAEIGIFLSCEGPADLEEKLLPLGHPLFCVTLDNGLSVSIVVRSCSFDPSVLPTSERMNSSKRTILIRDEELMSVGNLNALLVNSPGPGGMLEIVDVGGLSLVKKGDSRSADSQH